MKENVKSNGLLDNMYRKIESDRLDFDKEMKDIRTKLEKNIKGGNFGEIIHDVSERFSILAKPIIKKDNGDFDIDFSLIIKDKIEEDKKELTFLLNGIKEKYENETELNGIKLYLLDRINDCEEIPKDIKHLILYLFSNPEEDSGRLLRSAFETYIQNSYSIDSTPENILTDDRLQPIKLKDGNYLCPCIEKVEDDDGVSYNKYSFKIKKEEEIYK